MAPIGEKLNNKLNRWPAETAKKVEELIDEIIELADNDTLNLVRSREIEQEVLDIIDEREAG
jgi:hypothetical protein